MDAQPSQQHLVERLFDASLVCYPPTHRERFGPEMAQVFSDLCQEVALRDGSAGLLALWFATTLDLFKSALEMRYKELDHMTREHWIRLAGWALMIGAVAFAAGNILASLGPGYWGEPGSTDAISQYGLLVAVGSNLLLSIGMFGLAARYGAAAGIAGRGSLLLAGVAGLVAFVGGILTMLGTGNAWIIWALGISAMLVGLAGFGLTTLRRPVLERWRAAPLLAAVPILVWFGQSLQGYKLVTEAGVLIMAVSIFLIGHLLRGVARPRVALSA
jgi:hypothetical protein